MKYLAGYQDFHDGPLMWFCTDWHWAWVVGAFWILLCTEHGWVYEPIGTICADLVTAESKWESAKQRHSDVIVAELVPVQLLRDRNPHRVIDPFAERDWARELVANERKTPVRLDRLAHIINLDKETA